MQPQHNPDPRDTGKAQPSSGPLILAVALMLAALALDCTLGLADMARGEAQQVQLSLPLEVLAVYALGGALLWPALRHLKHRPRKFSAAG